MLTKRTALIPMPGRNPGVLRGFYAPQRDHAPKVQHPKPTKAA